VIFIFLILSKFEQQKSTAKVAPQQCDLYRNNHRQIHSI